MKSCPPRFKIPCIDVNLGVLQKLQDAANVVVADSQMQLSGTIGVLGIHILIPSHQPSARRLEVIAVTGMSLWNRGHLLWFGVKSFRVSKAILSQSVAAEVCRRSLPQLAAASHVTLRVGACGACKIYSSLFHLLPTIARTQINNHRSNNPMAELEGFHLANVLRMTRPYRTVSRASSNQANGDSIPEKYASTHGASEEDDDDEEDGEVVVRALNKAHEEWQKNILTFKAMLSSRANRLLAAADSAPTLEDEYEYGMEEDGYHYKAPIWPSIDDSDDTETISDVDSLVDHDFLPDYSSVVPPELPHRPSSIPDHRASSVSSGPAYDRAWLISQCNTHVEVFGDPSTDMTAKRLSIDIFTILRSDKPGVYIYLVFGIFWSPVQLARCRNGLTDLLLLPLDDDIQISLVDLLGFDNFEFITALLTSRRTIVDQIMAQVNEKIKT